MEVCPVPITSFYRILVLARPYQIIFDVFIAGNGTLFAGLVSTAGNAAEGESIVEFDRT